MYDVDSDSAPKRIFGAVCWQRPQAGRVGSTAPEALLGRVGRTSSGPLTEKAPRVNEI